MKDAWKTILAVVIVFLLGFFVCRWTTSPQIETHTETITVFDTLTHTVNNHHYHEKIIILKDTVEIPQNIDTSAILQDYYQAYGYSRTWSDSIISATLFDTITQNRLISGELKYKILRPQTIINNTTEVNTYSSYLYIGAGIETKDYSSLELNALYANKRFYAGIGYTPSNKGLSIKAGIPIIKMK